MKIAKKINGKWLTLGEIKKNQWGNLQLSMRKSPELQTLFDSDEKWLNFSVFEDDGKGKKAVDEHKAKAGGHQQSIELNDEIPF